MKKLLYFLENDNPETILERLLKLSSFIVMTFICILVLSFVVCYFLFGLFLLDGLYYIITGKTFVWKHLMD